MKISKKISGVQVKTFQLALMGLLLLVAIPWYTSQTKFAQARSLLLTDSFQSVTQQLGKNEVLYYTTTVHQRKNPNIPELNDPYHLNALTFYYGDRFIESWITADGFHQMEWSDASRKTLLSERVLTPNSFTIYDRLDSIAVEMPNQPTQNVDSSNQNKNVDIMNVTDLAVSPWGTAASLIEYKPTGNVTAASLEQSLQSFKRPPLYVNDLAFTDVKWKWQVDKVTGLAITRELLAGTESGEVALYSETSSAPTYSNTKDLPFTWGELSSADGRHLKNEISDANIRSQQPTNLSSSVDTDHNTIIYNSPYHSVAEVANHLEFPLIKLEKNFAAAHVQSQILFVDNPNLCTKRDLGYDFSLCGAEIWNEYRLSEPTLGQALRISEGARSGVVPKLKNALPPWNQSEKIELSIEGTVANAWVAKSSDTVGMISLMFEYQDAFVQMDGYNINKEQLLTFAQNLDVIAKVSYNIYLPLIQE